MERYIVAFGKGTRSCLGYNLGMAEVCLMLAAVVERFELELLETGLADVDLERDWFIPQPMIDTVGVRVAVTGQVQPR